MQAVLRYTAKGSANRNDMQIFPSSFSTPLGGDPFAEEGIRFTCMLELAESAGAISGIGQGWDEAHRLQEIADRAGGNPLFLLELVAAASESAEPIYTCDFYPTLAEVAGAQLPDQHPLDGTSLVPLLSGQESDLGREALYWHFPGYLEANVKLGTWRTTPAAAIHLAEQSVILSRP